MMFLIMMILQNEWMIFKGESDLDMDDDWGTFQETETWRNPGSRKRVLEDHPT